MRDIFDILSAGVRDAQDMADFSESKAAAVPFLDEVDAYRAIGWSFVDDVELELSFAQDLADWKAGTVAHYDGDVAAPRAGYAAWLAAASPAVRSAAARCAAAGGRSRLRLALAELCPLFGAADERVTAAAFRALRRVHGIDAGAGGSVYALGINAGAGGSVYALVRAALRAGPGRALAMAEFAERLAARCQRHAAWELAPRRAAKRRSAWYSALLD